MGWDLGGQVGNRLIVLLGKPAALDHTQLMLKTIMILALATVKRPSDLNLLWITPRTMQVTTYSFTFQPLFEAKNTLSSHPYGPMISLRHRINASDL